jgi:hypothetical protein
VINFYYERREEEKNKRRQGNILFHSLLYLETSNGLLSFIVEREFSFIDLRFFFAND